jgi:hypothetical protein
MPLKRTSPAEGKGKQANTAASVSPRGLAKNSRTTQSASLPETLKESNLKDNLTNEEIGWALGQIPILRAWANSVEGLALERLMAGEVIPGAKLVEGRANRIFSDPAQVRTILVEELELPLDDVAPRELVSPAGAEKLLKKAKLFKKFDMIKDLITRPRGKVGIAPESDPRPAYTQGNEFDTQTE